MPSSRVTILRILRQTESSSEETPRILGVDEWAYRRGKSYGTILVDLERSVPVDLLADQRATTFAAWLRSHPGVQVMSRDRAGEYARGARQGAPEAIQVADRYHRLRNVAEVGERILAHHRKSLKDEHAADCALPESQSQDGREVGSKRTRFQNCCVPPGVQAS
jgi:transposase